MEKSEQEVLKEISEIIFPLTGKLKISCVVHPQDQAVVLCSKCSAGICRSCLSKSPDLSRLICLKCLDEEKAGKSFLHYLKVLKFPVIWVMVCIFCAGIVYGLGVGNPNLEEMEKNDKNYPWYHKDAGKILFSQASRESQRAAALRFLNRDEEARQWSLKAAEAFAKCAEYWQKTPALPDLKVAEALMQANADNLEDAIAMLQLVPTKHSNQIYPVVQFYLGQLYLRKKDNKQADAYFKKAWDSRPRFDADIDNLIDGVANSMKELEMMHKVRKICQTKWTPKMADYIEERLGLEDEVEIKTIFTNIKEVPKVKKEKPKKPEKPKEVEFEIEMVE